MWPIGGLRWQHAGDKISQWAAHRRAAHPLCVELLEARALPSFLPPVPYDVGGKFVAGVAVRDFNGDGKLDIATTNTDSHTVSVLLGNGDGTFQSAVDYDAGLHPSGLVVGHFHDPDILDLAVRNSSAKTVSVLLGNGDGTFQPPVAYSIGTSAFPYGFAVGDLTGQGKLDIVTANGSSTNHGSVSVLLGNGDGSFQATATYPLPTDGDATTVALGDFNGDGRLDIAAGSLTGLNILLGNGDGTFQSAQVAASGALAWASLDVGDLRQDGHRDLVAGGNGLHVLLGNGDGTFQAPVTYLTSGIGSVALADFNGDGVPDIVATHLPHTLAILLGNGDGSFGAPQTYAVGPSPGTVAVGDFNGDDFPDLAVANSDFASVSVVINAADWSALPSRGRAAPKGSAMLADHVSRAGAAALLGLEPLSPAASVPASTPIFTAPLPSSPAASAPLDRAGVEALLLAAVGDARGVGFFRARPVLDGPADAWLDIIRADPWSGGGTFALPLNE
jgi:hypothetical protein